MTSTRWILIVALIGQIVAGRTGAVAQTPGDQTSRVGRIGSLSRQLRWHDEASARSYRATRDDVTRRLMSEIDGFISDNFNASSATPQQVGNGLDSVMGYGRGDWRHNVAFSMRFSGSNFLVVGIEVGRGGDAVDEDAISFHAYKENNRRFDLVAATDNLSNSPLVDLRAVTIASPPVSGEFWFLAMAVVPPQSPPTIALRLYAFDGQRFRMVWSPGNILAEGVEKAVEMSPNGFVVNRLFDPTGLAAHAPTGIAHEQYILTADGPQMVTEWKTERQ